MAKLENIERLVATLRMRAAKSIRDDNVSVLVGYTARYALFLHEMTPKTLGQGKPRPSGLGHYWGPSDYGPHFLLEPARRLTESFVNIIRNVLDRGGTLAQGLVTAGLYLQAASQKRVPVEHGFLRASAFTRLERR